MNVSRERLPFRNPFVAPPKSDRTAAVLAAFAVCNEEGLTYRDRSVLTYMVAEAREYDGALYWDQGREALFAAVGRDPREIGDVKAYESAIECVRRSLKSLRGSGVVTIEYPAVATCHQMYGINVPNSGFEATFSRRIRAVTA